MIYIALYFVLLYTQSALQSYGGIAPQPPPVSLIYIKIYKFALKMTTF